jgi:hypothetical protein
VHGERVEPDQQAVVLLDPDNGRAALGFIGARGADAIASLAAKLTHYSGFGRLLFDLPSVENRLRESLDILASPMSRSFADQAVPLKLPAAPVLTDQLPGAVDWRQTRCE